MADLLQLLGVESVPPVTPSRWFCDRAGCDGSPHGPHWHWCEHPLVGPHDKTCRHARAAQRPPDGAWFMWLLLSGRGFGKSRAAAEWLVDKALRAEPAEWAVVARSSADVRKNARDMDAGLFKVAGGLIEEGGHVEQYNKHEEFIRLDNGALIHCLSADKPDKLRGFNLAGAWCDEMASWRYPEAWDMLQMALREGEHTQVVVTTTPKPVPLLKMLTDRARAEAEKPLSERSYHITTGSTFDNAANLAPNFIREMESQYGGTRMGRQELLGELLFDTVGALVSYDMINDAREVAPPEEGFVRVVVAVDPAATYGEKSDETGIVVCAKDRQGHGWVLGDYSCRKSPRDWATDAVMAFERHSADRIVAEKNQGHAMVEEIIRSVAPHIPYTGVQAVAGKRLRAEPVTALYEQHRIHHLGTFPELEEQLVTWEPETRKSPDRMDALVHGMTELGLARWGQGRAFVEMWQRRAARGDTPREPSLRKRARSKAISRYARTCKHLYRAGPGGTRCVHCGSKRDVYRTAEEAPQDAQPPILASGRR